MTTAIRQQTDVQQAQDNIELLRNILTREQKREVAYDEAMEIGDALIVFYKVLVERVCSEPAN
jgi:flagellin-specific chaperone FliS